MRWIIIVPLFLSILIFPTTAKACTYESTLSGNHIDFKITTDVDNLHFIQVMHKNDEPSAPYKITSLQGPEGLPWVECRDLEQTYSGYSMVIQNRKQNADAAYWVSWIDGTHFRPIPSGVYGIDFTGTLNYSNISIEYGTIDEFGNPNTVGEPWTFCTRTGEVGFPTISPSLTPSATPSPTPTSTPTPSPIPTATSTIEPSPTVPPVNKVIFAPGITASWNVDALMNCNSNPVGRWILAPYAESVYNPLLQAFKQNGWKLLEFYYDWRKNPIYTSRILSEFIEEETDPNEKVNFVGHSMGGLIGKSYLDETRGQKLSSFLSVGTPYKGSALSYPPWEGAETWSNNLFEKIAITLYLKHCGGLFSNGLEMVREEIPSLQSLLPVDSYLQSKKESVPRLPINNNNQNNWFNNTRYDFSNVRSGNIAGIGTETLKIIQTKIPNKKDLNNGLWVDGAPAGKIVDLNGDGTVLKESAIMESADEKIIINQTHRGLVSSEEGIRKILNFLGTPTNPTSSIFDNQPNSALILIGNPATFSLVDEKGNHYIDKQGMIAVMNPKSGNYKLNLISRSNETTFIIAHFLQNGNVKYKEYKFKGYGLKFKNINFNSENPQDDILN